MPRHRTDRRAAVGGCLRKREPEKFAWINKGWIRRITLARRAWPGTLFWKKMGVEVELEFLRDQDITLSSREGWEAPPWKANATQRRATRWSKDMTFQERVYTGLRALRPNQPPARAREKGNKKWADARLPKASDENQWANYYRPLQYIVRTTMLSPRALHEHK